VRHRMVVGIVAVACVAGLLIGPMAGPVSATAAATCGSGRVSYNAVKGTISQPLVRCTNPTGTGGGGSAVLGFRTGSLVIGWNHTGRTVMKLHRSIGARPNYCPQCDLFEIVTARVTGGTGAALTRFPVGTKYRERLCATRAGAYSLYPGSRITMSAPPASGEIRTTDYLTSYGYPDNNPPSSDAICCSVLHQRAGGTGTYADPITIAASGGSTRSSLQFPPGTRFYFPNVRRYFIVEDSLGTPVESPTHLDQWAGGDDGSSGSATLACEDAVTGHFLVIRNPASTYAVVPGALVHQNTCTAQYGNTVTSSG